MMIRLIFSVLLCNFLLFSSFASRAAVSDLAVTGYQFVSKSRVSRTDYQYVYRINLSNQGGPLDNVEATVSSSSSKTTIVDPTVVMGSITNGDTLSTDTFSFRQNRRYVFNPAALHWVFSGDEPIPQNTAPVADAGIDQVVNTGAQVIVDGRNSSDADLDTLTYAWSLLTPSGSSATLSNATLSTPEFTADVTGDYTATLVVNDGTENSLPDSVTVTALFSGTNEPEIVSVPVTTGSITTAYVYDVNAVDIDSGEILTYALQLAPSGMTIDSGTGVISWQPDSTGGYDVDVLVTDSTGLTDRQIFLLQINNGINDQPPALAPIADQSTIVGQPVMITAIGVDPENEALRYGLAGSPTGMSINTNTGELVWSPAISQTGNLPASVTVTDPGGQSASTTFNTLVIAEAPNNPPTLNPVADVTVNVLETVQIDLIANDLDAGDVLTFSLNGAPADVQFDARNGRIRWTPDLQDIGSLSIIANVTDSAGDSGSTSFSIHVAEPQYPPVAVDDVYAVDRHAILDIAAPGVLSNDTDPNNDVLTASLVNPPVLGTLDSFSADGAFRYTPPPAPPITIGLREQCQSPAGSNSRIATAIVGDIDADGDPEIIGLGGSLFNYNIWVMDGASCTLESSVNISYLVAGVIHTYTAPTLVNLDDDPQLELVVVMTGPPQLGIARARLAAFNQDGTPVWTTLTNNMSEAISLPATNPGYSLYAFQGATVTDLDGDGTAEILMNLHFGNAGAGQHFSGIVAYNSDGTIRWEYQGVPQGGDADHKPLYVVDLDLDGTVEVLHHTNVVDHNGNLEFILPAELDVFGVASSHVTLAFANFDNDPFTEILARDFYNHYMFEHTGELKWSSPVLNGATSEITIAELDGDPLPEFAYHTGFGTGDHASWMTAFDSDGSVLWTHENSIYDSRATLLGIGIGTTAYDYDQDGIDELTVQLDASGVGNGIFILGGNDGVERASFIIGGGVLDPFSPLTTIADVDGDGAAEIVYPYRQGLGSNPYIVLEGLAGNPFPPARPVRHQHMYQPTQVNVDGSLPAYPEPHWLIPGLNKFHTAAVIPFEDPGATDSFSYTASDGFSISNEARVNIAITNVNPPTIVSTPALGASPGFLYLYGILVTDADFGDTFTFTLADAPVGMTIDNFGIIRWTPDATVTGRVHVQLVVTDSQGNTDQQAFDIDVVPPVIVPDILGNDETTAADLLTNAGLAVGSVTNAFSLTVPVGEVISQSVSGGNESAAGAFINYVISLGPQPVFVPDLVGVTPAVADATLTSLGLSLGTVNYVNSDNYPKGVTLAQSIALNTEVQQGTVIDLTVSSGPLLKIQLDSNLIGNGEVLPYVVSFFDNTGNPMPAPADMILSLVPGTDATGTIPALGTTNITMQTDTRGSYALRVQSVSLAVDLNEEFTVAASFAVDSSQASYRHFSQRINALEKIYTALSEAILANDFPAVQALGTQLESERALIDLDELMLTSATVPETGFLPLSPPGPVASGDAVVAQILLSTISAINESQFFLESMQSGVPRDDDLRNRFLNNMLDAQLDEFNQAPLSLRNSVAIAANLHQLLSIAVPRLVVADIDRTLSALRDAGLLARHHNPESFYAQQLNPSSNVQDEQLTFFTLGGMMSASSFRTQIIKDFYFPIVKQIIISMQNLVLQGLIRQFTTAENIPGIVTGASLSFHTFKLGNSIIESDTASKNSDGNIVLLIGPTLLSDLANALSGISGVTFNSVKQAKKSLKTVKKTGEDAVAVLQSGFKQITPHESMRGCIFSGLSSCRQIAVSDGIPSVYTDGKFPAPVLMIQYNAVQGTMSIGNFLFFSAPE